MEWVETTAKSVDEARDAALDQLGVGVDEAEFEVLESPRPGLFGRVRGEARVRARVKPAQVRPKNDQRRRSKGKSSSSRGEKRSSSGRSGDGGAKNQSGRQRSKNGGGPSDPPEQSSSTTDAQEATMSDDQGSTNGSEQMVSPDEVAQAAVTFMEGLSSAFGSEVTVDLVVEGSEIDVNVAGDHLGLLVGPGGRTLNAVQDLARVAAQRRLGDHETRLRIDVAGYRERRKVALGDFARTVAETVRSSGESRSLEPMTSADRKVVHDVLNEEQGVTTRSVGEDPDRRIIVEPA